MIAIMITIIIITTMTITIITVIITIITIITSGGAGGAGGGAGGGAALSRVRLGPRGRHARDVRPACYIVACRPTYTCD